MSYPPRPPMGMPPMFGGYGGPPPGMGMPPMGLPPPSGGGYYGAPPRPNTSVPPPGMRHGHGHAHGHGMISKPPMYEDRNSDHPLPYPTPTGPPVTVFVGNITEKWPDPMIRQLLSTCGQVINWKRVQGPSGKLQGFGFCEFCGPDAALRATRLLHDLEVGEQKMIVKVDAKTQTLLDEFKAERKKKNGGAPGQEESPKNGEENGDGDYMDTEMKAFDERAKQRIQIIFEEYEKEFDVEDAADKAKAEHGAEVKQQIQSKLHLLKLSSIDATLAGAGTGTLPEEPDLPEDIAQDEGKREIITREISIFRENMKQEQERQEERKRLEKERREREKEREERRNRDKEKGTEDITSPDHFSGGRDREKNTFRDNQHQNQRGGGGRDNHNNHNNRRNNNRDRDRLNDRDRRGGRSRDRRSKSRSVERIPRSPGPPGSKTRYREREEDEEQENQKRLERKAREKEAAYERRLREWESREGQKSREYKKLEDRLRRQEDDMAKEAKRMKQFFEDYDDEKHDPKYYKGKELQKRLNERAKELEDDNKDRQREREELEEMRLRMMTNSAKSTPSSASSLLDKYRKPSDSQESTPTPSLFAGLKMELKPSISSRLQAMSNSTQEKKEEVPTRPTLTIPQVTLKPMSNPTTPNANSLLSPAQALKSPAKPIIAKVAVVNIAGDEDSRHSFSPGPSPGLPSVSPVNSIRDDDDSKSPSDAPKRKRMDVKDVFNQDDDDADGLGLGRKRKLVPLDFGDADSKKSKKEEKNTDEKKKNIKALIDKIPTDKDALFAYEIDWEMVDTTLMEKRIRPWINKKIIEYIGEPEPTLVDFICSKVLGRSEPNLILNDVSMVLDDEAEVFVVKMWRLLVYEIEAKKYGLAAGKSQ